MFKVNDNYLKLPGSYLFSTIGKKVAAYKEANPDKEVISLGHSTAMHRILDMNFCAVQLLITITNPAVLTLHLMRFLSAMVQKVIPETLLIYFLRTM